MANNSITKKERSRSYYLKNREKIRARSKARYEAKRTEILEQQKQRRDANLDHFHQVERERYWEQVEIRRERSKRYYRNNKAKHYEAVKRYRQQHRDRETTWKKRWLANHPEKRRVAVRNNKSRRRKGAGRYTLEQLFMKYSFHGWRCYLCSTPVTFKTSHPDHRIPISRGGSNWIANIAPACISCNLRKNRRTESEYRALLTDP